MAIISVFKNEGTLKFPVSISSFRKPLNIIYEFHKKNSTALKLNFAKVRVALVCTQRLKRVVNSIVDSLKKVLKAFGRIPGIDGC